MQEIGAPKLELQLQWDLDSLIGYLGTWSAVQRHKRATGHRSAARPAGGDGTVLGLPVDAKTVIWPLQYLRVGRTGSRQGARTIRGACL